MKIYLAVVGILLIIFGAMALITTPYYFSTDYSNVVILIVGISFILLFITGRKKNYPVSYWFVISAILIIASYIIFEGDFRGDAYLKLYKIALPVIFVSPGVCYLFFLLFFRRKGLISNSSNKPLDATKIIIAFIVAATLVGSVYIYSKFKYEQNRYEMDGFIRIDKYEGTYDPVKRKH